MPMFINLVCDINGCTTSQQAAFEDLEETYNDLIQSYRDQGWTIDDEGVEYICPAHGSD
jgi:hypothetical protein